MWAGVGAGGIARVVELLSGLADSGVAAAAAPRPVAYPSGASAPGRKPVRVGLLGARGFTGREFVRLLAGHPQLELVCASSRALVGQDALQALGVPEAGAAVTPGLTVSDVGPEQIRCVGGCLAPP